MFNQRNTIASAIIALSIPLTANSFAMTEPATISNNFSYVQLVPVSDSKGMFSELLSLIKRGKRTESEYRAYLKKHDFDQGTEDKLPGFTVSGVDIFNDSPSPEDIIRLYFDEDQQLVAIFSFSGLGAANSDVFVEKAEIANGKLLFLVKKHPMAKQLKRHVKEIMSNAG
jgi:hypothetical protein